MADENEREAGLEEVQELEVDGTDSGSLDAAMREAVAAVEAVEKKQAHKKAKTNNGGDSGGGDLAAEAAASGKDTIKRGGSKDSKSRGTERDMDQLRDEIAALKDSSLRTLADFDNFRKRSDREKEEARRYALLEPMRDILPVIDNLERALASKGRLEDLKEGVELILKQMKALLERFAVLTVPALGEAFDPTVHEAVMREEAEEIAEPTVVEEFQKGYLLHDRLIRPAMVKVAMPASRGEDSNPEA